MSPIAVVSGKLTADRATFMKVLRDYEFEAAGFGLQLLHERGITGHDQWYSDFVHTDWRYVERYYETDSIPPWEDCVVTGSPLIRAVPIPPLTLRAGRGPLRVLGLVLGASFVVGEVALMLAQVPGVAIVVRLVERRPVPREAGVVLFELVGPALQALVFLTFGLGHRVLPAHP